MFSLLYLSTCQADRRNHTSMTGTSHSFTNDSKAIMSESMSYDLGQLTIVPHYYRHIDKVPYPIACSPYHAHSSERSVCPWKFQKNIDQNRIPREITEAVCRVRNTEVCGQSTASRHVIRNGCEKHECREVKYYITVLRRISPDSNHYVEILEPVSAGCTCMCSELKPVPPARRATICD